MVIEMRTTPRSEVPKEPLFTLNGTTYEIPSEIGAEIALQALERFRAEPELAVIAWMMEEVLGKEAWKALRNAEGLHPADLAAVIEAVREKTMAPIEDQGKS